MFSFISKKQSFLFFYKEIPSPNKTISHHAHHHNHRQRCEPNKTVSICVPNKKKHYKQIFIDGIYLQHTHKQNDDDHHHHQLSLKIS